MEFWQQRCSCLWTLITDYRDGKTYLNSWLEWYPPIILVWARCFLCVCVCVPRYECTCLCLLFKALLKTAEATLFSNSCFSSFLLLWIGPLTDGGNSTRAQRGPVYLPLPPPTHTHPHLSKGMLCPSVHSVWWSVLPVGYCLSSLYHWSVVCMWLSLYFHAMLWIYTCWQEKVSVNCVFVWTSALKSVCF